MLRTLSELAAPQTMERRASLHPLGAMRTLTVATVSYGPENSQSQRLLGMTQKLTAATALQRMERYAGQNLLAVLQKEIDTAGHLHHCHLSSAGRRTSRQRSSMRWKANLRKKSSPARFDD